MIVFFGIAFSIVKLSFCQPSAYRFENITNEQGIADRVINAIIQDTEGFIWIASVDGLTRYDGYNAVVYRHRANDPYSLSDNEVYALCIDGNGSLWIGTRNGLNRYDEQNDRFETFLHDDKDSNSLTANEIFSLAKDTDGNIWIGTYNGGVDKVIATESGKGFKRAGYSFLHYRHNEKDSNSISNDQVFSVCFDKMGRAWVGTINGVNIIDEQAKKIVRLYADTKDKNSISNNAVNKIVSKDDGSVLLCGKNILDNVLLPADNGAKKMYVKHLLPLLADNQNNSEWAINDLMIDHYNNYWVALHNLGVLKFNLSSDGSVALMEKFFDDQSEYSLSNKIVFSFFEDRSGVVWIGTTKGISKYVPSKARFNAARFSQHGVVSALLYDKQNRIWRGADSDTLTIAVNAIRHSLCLPSINKQFNQVNALYQSKAGDIYVATFADGLYIIPNNLKAVYDVRKWIHVNAFSGLPNNNIYAITEDKKGIIWLGTYKGLCNYNPQTKKINNVYVPPGANIVSAFIVRTLFADENNILWCGTDEGLMLIKDNKIAHKFYSNDTDSNSLSHNRITVIYGDDNKNIWVGTKSGLNLFDPLKNNFKRFSLSNNHIDESMMSIREDRSGNLWIGTNNGLLKFNIREKKITRYTVEGGLCSGEFQANAVCSDDKNGLIYFGTANGVVSFNPGHIVSNSYKPPVVITDIKILDQSYASISDTVLINTYRREKKLLLKYNQNFFSFEFAALSYNNSKANKYAYILEGVDRQWHEAGTQNFAGYTDIRPGHYVFKVKGSNNDDVWNNNPVTVAVIISPPWWGTWWFYTLCSLAACAIIYVIYRIRIQQVLKVYRLRSSIAKDLHDDVGSALSSIALLSNISEKAKTKVSLKPEEIFSRIGDTSKRMIDLMDDIVWSVNPDNDRFSNMLVRMREYAAEMLESKNIDFTFHIADDIDELRIPMEMRKDYFLIFKEAINNLAKCSGCTHANISIKRINKNIITAIEDNGKGFNPQIINSGNGLKNMQQRAAAMKAKLHIETASGEGTSVKLTMPA
ncbi:MAG TPA: two-component regulator propeller domain-containing protein [Parafilimonas sp.]|nr:two-component regulator propeller domain-containing protein [Parafilimonas sp.]